MFIIEELLITDTVFFIKFGILFLIIMEYSFFESRILSFSYIHIIARNIIVNKIWK